MKKAFTMIELIFVIVILGILAAVALPKFLGVAQQAHEGNLKSFVGTLNRTVAPTLWSESISGGHDGDIAYTALQYDKDTNPDGNLTKYIDMPKEIKNMDLSDCNSTTDYQIVGTADKNVAGKDYFIACIDGNANQAPKFILIRQTSTGTVTLGDNNTTDINATSTTATFSNGETGTILR
ncbi:type II secretion system protein [Nautilia sp. PV-1]|uniref:type II secretion system protein n=1 Tax=Nautilia sp. PV-1 TaxID=2579250 RepID=UPI000FD6F027|nr:prepilin-type N-terminal cleavage/methylation domain-containing protein [Nautilia sp. PV-1]AZV46804.1 type II secretion system protein [Nautilia sp. PV-1]